MAEKIATRAAYGKALEELAAQEPNLVVLDADLSGSTMTKGFGAEHPDRFFDMGIAEANMVGVAAGLATCGKKPFVNSFAMFAAGRAWEQVRNSVAYPGLNVKVVGSHGGLSVGEDGATHQCIEDLAIMRAIPNMTVLCPCDGNEMKQAVKALLAYDGPAYLRQNDCSSPTLPPLTIYSTTTTLTADALPSSSRSCSSASGAGAFFHGRSTSGRNAASASRFEVLSRKDSEPLCRMGQKTAAKHSVSSTFAASSAQFHFPSSFLFFSSCLPTDCPLSLG